MWPTSLGIVLLVAGMEYASACSCAEAHIQTHFCSADYVMQVRLKKSEKYYSKVKTYDPFAINETRVTQELSDIKYYVHINRIFKLGENEAGLRKNSTAAVLYTPPNDARCGIHLDLRTKYLIGGRFSGPRATLHLCNLVRPWPLVSKRQRKNLLAMYEENCKCQVENWYEEVDGEDKCKWPTNRNRSCYERASACIVNKNSVTGGCKWHRNKHMRACKKAARMPQLP